MLLRIVVLFSLLFTSILYGKELPTFSGTNQYYLPFKSRSMVDDFFIRAKALNLTVVRTWAFCEASNQGGLCFQPAPYTYDEAAFIQLDYVVAKAKEQGIQLILTLVDNWPSYGGIPQYVKWYGLNDHDDFYRDSKVKDTYKAYVSHVLNRTNTLTNITYKNEPTILALELGNELRSNDLPALYAWTDEMAHFIKGIDTQHLLTTGSEGSEYSDSYEMHKSDAIDFVSFHLYPENWGWGVDEQRTVNYIRDQAAVARRLGKPLFLGEFGLLDKNKRRDFFQKIYQTALEEKVNGVAFWLLSGRQADGTLYPDYDGFTVYYPESQDVIDVIQGFSKDVNTKRFKQSRL